MLMEMILFKILVFIGEFFYVLSVGLHWKSCIFCSTLTAAKILGMEEGDVLWYGRYFRKESGCWL